MSQALSRRIRLHVIFKPGDKLSQLSHIHFKAGMTCSKTMVVPRTALVLSSCVADLYKAILPPSLFAYYPAKAPKAMLTGRKWYPEALLPPRS